MYIDLRFYFIMINILNAINDMYYLALKKSRSYWCLCLLVGGSGNVTDGKIGQDDLDG